MPRWSAITAPNGLIGAPAGFLASDQRTARQGTAISHLFPGRMSVTRHSPGRNSKAMKSVARMPLPAQTTALRILLALLVLSGSLLAGEALAEGVAFHLDSDEHMSRSLRQIARQQEDMPGVDIRVILISGAVNAAVEGAADEHGGLYSAQLEQLLAAGARIFACETTMIDLNLRPGDLAFGIETVPSGIVELTRLQLSEQFAYLKL